MALTESRSLPVPQQQAWEALNDATVLKACIPGCESIEADGEHAWAVALTTKGKRSWTAWISRS
ncbi:MAG: hypothetical protein EPN70_19645 [Paraburkholderia sp.]|nr:MAG: hypothetical protein EPN70_19645 [Paraburkholderia sp.]TAM30150.1 MAG: hypothetical protein EPN59_09835 [Paraburkholderia sp.]